jgi:hypothetical protein
MEVIWTILTCAVLALTGYLVLRNRHENEMRELASECSGRLQTMNRELTAVCTEPETEYAKEIVLRLRLNVSAETLLEKINERTD